MLTCSWWRLSNSGEPLFAVGTTFITVAREGTFSCRTEKCYYKLNLINFIWHINVTISYQKMCHYSYKLVDNKNRKNSNNLRLIVEFTKLFRKLNKAYWKVQFCCICKHVSRGSLILFSWRVNGRFFFAWSVNEDFFPLIRESIFFHPWETGFRFFSWSMKNAFTFAWFLNHWLLWE